jgi:eukaryotic-like serine/threonine-protein kinase
MKAGALIAGKYRLTRPIGKGAMGTVWEATHEGTSRQVAVKLILESTDELRHRLVREARAYGALRHRNIVEVLDVGQTDEGDPFLVMQLLVGETLADRLVRQRRLGVPEATRIARDVARALATAHAASIIHRDLKPANIFLHDEPGEDATVIKVVDFGVSKNLLDSDGLSTVAGGMVGSPAYMSPEQAAAGARGPVDHRADVWSLGVVLFEMLTGVRPLQGDANTILAQIVWAEIPLVTSFVRTVDPKLAALVARCLDRDLTRRVGSAADLAVQLQIYAMANLGSGSSPLGREGSGASIPIAPPSRSDAAVLASPRAAFASVAERDPAVRSPQPQGGPLSAGPTMPGAGDDDDEATAKLSPDMLRALRPAVQPASPQMPLRARATVPIQGDPASSPFAATLPIQNDPALAPLDFKSTVPLQNHLAFGSGASWAGPVPTTAKLDPNSAWAAEPTVTNRGTVRMPSDVSEKIRNLEAERAPLEPPPAPPPPIGLSSISSTAPLMQQSSGDPSSASQAAALQQQKRRRTSVIVAGSVVGVALAILVVVVIRPRIGAAPASDAPGTSAMAIASVPPVASVSAQRTAIIEDGAPIATTSPSAKPVASAQPSAATPVTPPTVKAPVVTPVPKQPSSNTPAPVAKPTSKLPGFLIGSKKFNPTKP